MSAPIIISCSHSLDNRTCSLSTCCGAMASLVPCTLPQRRQCWCRCQSQSTCWCLKHTGRLSPRWGCTAFPPCTSCWLTMSLSASCVRMGVPGRRSSCPRSPSRLLPACPRLWTTFAMATLVCWLSSLSSSPLRAPQPVLSRGLSCLLLCLGVLPRLALQPHSRVVMWGGLQLC